MYYTTKKTQKKVANLGYGWALHHAKILINKGVMNTYLITHNSKIILAIDNGKFYKIVSPYGSDLTGKISPGQFLDMFGVHRNGQFIGVYLDKVSNSYARDNLPETILQKIKDYTGYLETYRY
jgi:cytochrome oxidase Cu insertion factor (SCO1/SenC/PrrC family)